MRVICLDIGEKRIGVAVTDPLDITAQAVETIWTKGFTKDAERVLALCEQYQTNRGSSDPLADPNQQAAAAQDTRQQQPRQPVVREKMPGRNDPCPCGSGKKFKNCHGKGLV